MSDPVQHHIIEIVLVGAGWQPLTKKLHGALSGGEKAIALHLPLFAAVAAHYQSRAGVEVPAGPCWETAIRCV